MRIAILFILILLKAGPAFSHYTEPAYETAYEKSCRDVISNTTARSAGERLRSLMMAYRNFRMYDDPETATLAGYPGLNYFWRDLSLETFARREKLDLLTLAAVKSIARGELSSDQAVDYDVFFAMARQNAEQGALPGAYLQLSPSGGVHVDTVRLIAAAPRATEKDYRAILSRLMALPLRLQQSIALMRQGSREGFAPPPSTLRDVPAQIAELITDDPLRSAYLAPFAVMPDTLTPERRQQFIDKAKAAYVTRVKPALQELLNFVRQDYSRGL